MGAMLSTASKELRQEDGAFLLRLARKAVGDYLSSGERPGMAPERAGPVAEERACFVTIHSEGRLRGCIGSLAATRPLALDVMDNAVNSAFCDPRFPPLLAAELPLVKFSISVLGLPHRIRPDGPDGLLRALAPRKDGLIIAKGPFRATFLPAVWEVIEDKEEFLSHLCIKAGLDSDEWRDTASMEFYVYQAQEFSE
jgi:AmmeMemoRadiSam system protein A